MRAAHAPFEGVYATAPAITNHSQFAADGPRAATDDAALGPWGTVDTAGNLREWVWNFAGDSALALGGSWLDYAATYQYAYTTDPMNRSLEHGMRLMQLLDNAPIPVELLEPITLAFDETLVAREPVSDDAFEAMRFQLTAGSRTPLDISVSEVDSTDVWVAEEVVQRFGDDDQFVLYVVRPRGRHDA